MRPATRLLLTAAAAFTILTPAVSAQNSPNRGVSTFSNPRTTTARLADTPTEIEAVGLRFYPVEGSRAQVTRLGDQSSVQVLPAQGTNWVMNIATPRTRDATQTVDTVADAILEQLLESTTAVEVRGEQGSLTGRANVIRVPDLVINGQTASRFYVALQTGTGEDRRAGTAERVIRGYTVFKPQPDRFVTFELVTTEREFANVRPVYELMIGTARFTDVGESAERTRVAAERGAEFIEGLTPASYAGAIAAARERWDRLYEPAASGSDRDAREIGYRRLRAREGQRGELRPEVPQARWRASDRQRGYIVQLDSRVLQDRQIIDIESIFFLAADRETEGWTIRVAVRDREGGPRRPATIAYTEVGVRDGNRLNVVVEPRGGASSTHSATVDRTTYLSQVEHFLLPHLLVLNAAPGDFAFTYWSSNATAVTTRRDALENPGAGVFELESVLIDSDPPQVSRFNEQGRLIRTSLPETDQTPRRVWQPIELPRLTELWRSKSLPMN